MVSYKGRKLKLNQRVFNECMKLTVVSEWYVDQVYITEKKRLSKLLDDADSYDDLIWLICERIGL